MGYKESRTVGRVTEITHIVPFKQGGPRGLPGIRYADRCRIILESFAKLEAEGFVSPVRRFSGIHFARWTLIDGDTRLLFTTNFDGSWEDYIGAFVRQIPWSLGLIWQNCENYPLDRKGDGGALIPGAADYALFSRFVKRYQVPAGLFYSQHGDLTVRDIRYLRVFQEEASRMLEGGQSATLGEIQRRVMARTAAIDRAYETLPGRPFPQAPTPKPMSEADKAVFRVRIGQPLAELYRAYDDATMKEIFGEFGLLPGGEGK
jgi:hypothetical protein